MKFLSKINKLAEKIYEKTYEKSQVHKQKIVLVETESYLHNALKSLENSSFEWKWKNDIRQIIESMDYFRKYFLEYEMEKLNESKK